MSSTHGLFHIIGLQQTIALQKTSSSETAPQNLLDQALL